jgi:hypothetical protein
MGVRIAIALAGKIATKRITSSIPKLFINFMRVNMRSATKKKAIGKNIPVMMISAGPRTVGST